MKNIVKAYLTLFSFLLILNSSAQDFKQSPVQDFPLLSPILADFDGDNYLDVFGWQKNFAGPNKGVLQLNNGTSPIDFSVKELNLNLDIEGQPAAADLDDDNDIDIVVAIGSSYDLYYLQNDGSANFSIDSLGVSGGELLKLVDIDNDDDLDIIGINTNSNSVDIFLNDGNQNFTTLNILSNSDYLELFDIGDLNNDGNLDIVLGYTSGNHIVWLKNNGGNNFEESSIISNNFSGLTSLILGDINNDGNMDVVATRGFLGSAFINDGGAFMEEGIFTYNNAIRNVTLGDYNGDNKMDIVIGTNTHGIFWFKNISTSTLVFESALEVSTVVSRTFSILHGDLDKDGDEDLIVSNEDFWWFENIIPQEPVGTVNLIEKVISIQPNPCVDIITIENFKIPCSLNITDLNGRILSSSELTSNVIDVSKLEPGLYCMSLTNSNQTLTTMIVKQK